MNDIKSYTVTDLERWKTLLEPLAHDELGMQTDKEVFAHDIPGEANEKAPAHVVLERVKRELAMRAEEGKAQLKRDEAAERSAKAAEKQADASQTMVDAAKRSADAAEKSANSAEETVACARISANAAENSVRIAQAATSWKSLPSFISAIALLISLGAAVGTLGQWLAPRSPQTVPPPVAPAQPTSPASDKPHPHTSDPDQPPQKPIFRDALPPGWCRSR